ncbi:FliI/YscN family ATPase [Aquabacterium sp. A7-Y]|uniref:FliI/YscN family ATPase n=1 Tax=Aquabacterium sp. A7-Y TaxID=1349605 RepID=UPI00223D08B1|nr:FliI/YscN family ATPase [Aquabacterium sp. A7-Y]MCW7540872.1 FliI/YscN family ATPase [Aquabacterium sp. A7-Y]
MHKLAAAIRHAELAERGGRVTQARGQFLEAEGLASYVGEICEIGPGKGGRGIEAEVVGFTGTRALLMPYRTLAGIAMGSPVVATGRTFKAPVGATMVGRVIDAFGQPLDGKGPIRHEGWRDCETRPPAAMQRSRITEVLETGVKVIDGLLTLAKGQRVGLFAGSGVGKSTLLGMVAQGIRADVNVIALIGERGREVREFVEDQLGPQGLQRSVVVVATADEPALLRVKAAYVATTIAEHFRDQGQAVMLTMDSLTRFAMARREIGLAAGEPPTARGYTPSVFSEIPQLCERCGPGVGTGSISAIYTVLVEGDDLNEPVTDAIRATLDGHIVLSREIASSGQYPAVDVLKSISRLSSTVTTAEEQKLVRSLLAALALYERNRALIEVGAYKPQINPRLDVAVHAMPRIQAFLAQSTSTSQPRAETLRQLKALVQGLGSET